MHAHAHVEPDDDDTILTDAELDNLRPAAEVLPAEWLAAHRAQRRRRGRQKAPTKRLISLRLDRDVLAAWKATGRGWQSRMQAILAAHAPRRITARRRVTATRQS
jgi:uncharacterized protein (DUF4415 family)